MTKFCEYCKCEFERREALLDAVANADPRWHGMIWIRRPKTYAEIRLANRLRHVESGWRGAPVAGGGHVHHNEPWLMPCEYQR